jgi:glycosyltransferase involved in cell wall biosynthesis
MRIAVVGPVYPVKGGISYYTTEMCRRLSKKHQVVVFSFERLYTSFLYSFFYKGNNQLDTSKKTIDIGVENRRTISGNPLSWLKCALLIRRMQPEVILVTWVDTYMFPLVWLLQFFKPKNAKIVFVCHNIMGHDKRLFARPISRLVFSGADGVITHASGETKELLDVCPGVKYVQAYLPAYTLQGKSASVKKELGLREKTLLFFGYVRPFKGLRYLLKALPLVLKKVDLDLLIVGEFWEGKQEYLDLIQELGIQDHVKMVDYYVPNEDVSKYFACADVNILPYVETTQSAVVQVAYAHDIPIIASRTGGLADDVIDGKTGLLVEPRNEQALAQAIIKFYNEKMRAAMVKHVKKYKRKFSWEEYMRLLESLF